VRGFRRLAGRAAWSSPSTASACRTTIRPAPPPGGPCSGNPEFAAGGGGSAPGFTAATHTSSDGRLQFAVSLTLAMDDAERGTVPPRITNALKTLFCPTK
jgi:hypothetical protein